MNWKEYRIICGQSLIILWRSLSDWMALKRLWSLSRSARRQTISKSFTYVVVCSRLFWCMVRVLSTCKRRLGSISKSFSSWLQLMNLLRGSALEFSWLWPTIWPIASRTLTRQPLGGHAFQTQKFIKHLFRVWLTRTQPWLLLFWSLSIKWLIGQRKNLSKQNSLQNSKLKEFSHCFKSGDATAMRKSTIKSWPSK